MNQSPIPSPIRVPHRALLRAAVCAQSALSVPPGRRPLEEARRGAVVSPTDPATAPRSRRRDLGQATTEYALVLLGAAAVALLVVTWATAGGGAGRIGRLFDRVIDAVLGQI